MLDADDCNRIIEISSNNQSIVQIVNGVFVKTTNAYRVKAFWQSIQQKYGFVAGTEETNVDGHDPRFFMAAPLEESKSHYCKLCKQVSDPDIHSGCDRHKEEGCNWYSK